MCSALVIAAAVYGIPWIRFVLSTVSTDNAFVNGHVTFVAPRVHGQVARVLVDDNNRVGKGDLLVELDKEPFRDAVAVKKAAVDTAQADLDAAKATVRGIEAQARSRRWQLQQAIENAENQIALLHARVAALRKAKATLTLAQQEFDRTAKLVVDQTASRELYDQRNKRVTRSRLVSLADVLIPADDEAWFKEAGCISSVHYAIQCCRHGLRMPLDGPSRLFTANAALRSHFE